MAKNAIEYAELLMLDDEGPYIKSDIIGAIRESNNETSDQLKEVNEKAETGRESFKIISLIQKETEENLGYFSNPRVSALDIFIQNCGTLRFEGETAPTYYTKEQVGNSFSKPESWGEPYFRKTHQITNTDYFMLPYFIKLYTTPKRWDGEKMEIKVKKRADVISENESGTLACRVGYRKKNDDKTYFLPDTFIIDIPAEQPSTEDVTVGVSNLFYIPKDASDVYVNLTSNPENSYTGINRIKTCLSWEIYNEAYKDEYMKEDKDMLFYEDIYPGSSLITSEITYNLPANTSAKFNAQTGFTVLANTKIGNEVTRAGKTYTIQEIISVDNVLFTSEDGTILPNVGNVRADTTKPDPNDIQKRNINFYGFWNQGSEDAAIRGVYFRLYYQGVLKN